jgi:UDP-3-O-[3-hydroxymyristoyl] glucosamine N-acyltransferase
MTIVTKSITSAGQYTGNMPAMPHREWSKSMVRLRQLDEIARKIKRLENNNK